MVENWQTNSKNVLFLYVKMWRKQLPKDFKFTVYKSQHTLWVYNL